MLPAAVVVLPNFRHDDELLASLLTVETSVRYVLGYSFVCRKSLDYYCWQPAELQAKQIGTVDPKLESDSSRHPRKRKDASLHSASGAT